MTNKKKKITKTKAMFIYITKALQVFPFKKHLTAEKTNVCIIHTCVDTCKITYLTKSERNI